MAPVEPFVRKERVSSFDQILVKSEDPRKLQLAKTSVSVTRRIGQVMFAIEREAGNWGQRRLL